MTPPSFRSVRDRLAGLPAHMSVFDAVVGQLRSVRDVVVVATGSLATGHVDEWSDLDLAVVATPEGAALEAYDRAKSEFVVLADFDGRHLGATGLRITYLDLGMIVVKVDLLIVGAGDALPGEGVVVVGDRAAGRTGAPSPPLQTMPVDVALLDQRVIGWTWYTVARAARGESFQAANAVDYTRKHAVVPLLLDAAGAAQCDYRRLEERLSGDVVRLLQATHPRDLSGPELVRAAVTLGRLYLEVRSRRPEPFVAERSLRRMLDLALRQSAA